MKTKIIVSVIVVLTWAVSNSRAQEFTLTTTRANTASSMAKIEVPALTGNPQAIIVATPVGEMEELIRIGSEP